MIIGQSQEMAAIRKMIREIAKTDENVLIIGEFGSGKKTVAREIAEHSRQKNRPFVVVNCTAVGDTITDQDLFGAKTSGERGVERQIGLFEQAKKGVLYLDNVHELKSEYQQKFVNILREKKFRQGDQGIFLPVDFRVFSAAPDSSLFKNDAIRKDLMNLFSPFTISIPALRERKQDIPYLFSHFLETFCRSFNREIPPIPAELFESLMEYEWKGNVLELENTVRNLVLMSPEGTLALEYLPFEIKKHPFEFLENRNLPEAVSEIEKYLIRRALQKFAGNQTKAAKALNVSEAALRYKMKKHGFLRKAF